jgi:pimeloyl-ACP methyl ester carboxylesterase
VPLLDRNGVKIYYEDHGDGPPILLSHGYSATCRMWNEQIAALVARHRVIVWDMRGHGETDDPDDPAAYSEALTVEDMAALLRRCQIDRAVIGGLSLGGYMSLAFHLAHPEMVRALMLFDTGARNSAPATSRPAASRHSAKATRSALASIAQPAASPVRRAA